MLRVIIIMDMMMSTPTETVLRLLAWLSPGFPTGAFAYSHGLEWAVESGDIRDEATLCDWLADVLVHGAGRSDAILLRHARRATELAGLAELCELASAIAPCSERRMETLAQGQAFARAAMAWGGVRLSALLGSDVPYPIAVGALAADHDIDEDATVAAYLQAMAANLISTAVRLVPLGQTAGLRVLVALEPTLLAVAAETRAATLDDLGGACFRSDVAAMRHETQYTRLFRS
jgi:urease accessory protein